ncbi:MAG: aminotransferase class V-fold PLP-dependent enzyme [Chloroflexi bacterium]|nr:aminotransferase class V-fold PLP-dependent enzyme [Chloroflexota bacterium]
MVPPVSSDLDRLAEVRAALPALAAGIYLNTGSVGPLPAETAAAMAELTEYEVRTGRAHAAYFDEMLQRMAEARSAVAAVLTTDVENVALTHATTDGMNIGIWSIDWRPGDRAVTTDLEHPGGVGALFALRDRLGIELEVVRIADDFDDEAVLAAFAAAIDGRTRAVVISHVLWATGRLMPVAAIAELAHAQGALLIVDGSQSAGAIRVDLAATGADLYAIPAQKWLLGPEGMGALAVRPGLDQRSRAAYAGHFSFERFDLGGSSSLWTDARRFEASNYHRPSITGMARSIGWLSMYVGLDWIYRRGAAMARLAAGRLGAIPGVEVLTPPERMATLVTFRIGGWPAQAALDELGARVFAIARVIAMIDALRISVGFFTSDDELERFLGAVELLARHTPGSLPPRRSLNVLAGS